MLRRLLPVLALFLPLLAGGLAAAVPAHAEAAPEATGAYLDLPTRTVRYGETSPITVFVIAEHGIPDGTVSIEIEGQLVGTGTLSPTTEGIAQGQALFPRPLLEVGDHQVVLSYAGNERFAASTYTSSIIVSKAHPTVELTGAPEQLVAGQSVTLTATIDYPTAGAVPTGTLTFRRDSNVLAVRPVAADGTATFTTTDVPAGQPRFTATLSSDSHYNQASGELQYDVQKVATTTELSVTPTAATFGDTVRIAAVVRGGTGGFAAPAGSVTFTIDGRPTTVALTPASGPTDGLTSVATLDRSDLDAGTHRIKAEYSGSAHHSAGAEDTENLVVARRATTLTATPAFLGLNPFITPNAVLRATLVGNGRPVAGAPVTFTAGTTALCTATTDAQGVAVCDASAQGLTVILSGGYVASYSGDANNTASSVQGNLIG